MNALQKTNIEALRALLKQNTSLLAALPRSVGGTSLSGGFWRIFSSDFPQDGVVAWNKPSAWKQHWDIPSDRLFAWGEDFFGNQLVLKTDEENVFLWHHEDSQLIDLYLGPTDLLSTVLESGLEWIDFYANGSLEIAKVKIANVPAECHLHWTTPLILGGLIKADNTSVVERHLHLAGHAELWRQVSLLGLGDVAIVKPAT